MSKRVGRPRLDASQKNKKPTDKITCITCNGVYTRSNRAAHNKTKQHQQALKYEAIIKNIIQLIKKPSYEVAKIQ